MATNIVEAIVEIQKDSQIKYEWDRRASSLVVDRILRDGFRYPCAYGFIPNTLDWDGDELDVLIFSSYDFLPGVRLRVKIVGALKMIDEGETDTKLIGIHADDYTLESLETLEDLGEGFKTKVEYFFNNYKNWKGASSTQVSGFESPSWAFEELKTCQELFEKYQELPKREFVEKMKSLFPNKYK